MKSMRICVLYAGIAVLAMGFIQGCSEKTPPTPPDETKLEQGETVPLAAKTWIIGMSQCNRGEPWRVQMDADIKRAAEKHDNIEVVFKGAQNDTLRQGAHIEEFISAGVDLLIVSPKEAAPLTPRIKAAYDAEIPVIVLDRAVLGEDFTCFIGADNKLIGEAAGKWIAQTLGGKGNVVELKGPPAKS